MSTKQFDDRYPAMFQPGGEDLPASEHVDVPVAPDESPAPIPVVQTYSTTATRIYPPVVQRPVVARPAISGQAVPEPNNPSAQNLLEDDEPGALISGATKPAVHPRRTKPSWLLPVVIGTLLLTIGVIVAGIPPWIAATSDDPNALNQGMMWTYAAAQAGAPLIGVGLGVLATAFFLYVQHHPTRREGLRRLFTIVTIAVVTAGVYAYFATYFLQPVPQESYDSVTGDSYTVLNTPLTAITLGLVAFEILLVGLLMLSALIISPRYSRLQMSALGLLFVAVGVFSQFAQQIFPDVPLSTQYYEGGNQSIASWPYWLQALTPVLFTAGFLVIAAAVLMPLIKSVRLAPVASESGQQLDDSSDADADPDADPEAADHG